MQQLLYIILSNEDCKTNWDLTCMCWFLKINWSVSLNSKQLWFLLFRTRICLQYVKSFFFFPLLTDDIIKLNKKEERKQYSPKMKRGLHQNRTRQFRTPGSKWGIQQQKGGCIKYDVDCGIF